MRIRQPNALLRYRYNRRDELRFHGPTWLAGWFGIGFLALAAVMGVGLQRPDWGMVMGIVALILLVTYFLRMSRSPLPPCRRCGARMNEIDVDWTVAEWKGKNRKLWGYIVGADGIVYCPSRSTTENSGHALYKIEVVCHSWWVCDRCQLCFLGRSCVLKRVLQTESRSRFNQVKEALRTDPDEGCRLRNSV